MSKFFKDEEGMTAADRIRTMIDQGFSTGEIKEFIAKHFPVKDPCSYTRNVKSKYKGEKKRAEELGEPPPRALRRAMTEEELREARREYQRKSFLRRKNTAAYKRRRRDYYYNVVKPRRDAERQGEH